MEDPSSEDHVANLKEYEEQLQQVGELLLDDPDNEEYRGIYDGLVEVIKLTKELIASSADEIAPSARAASTSGRSDETDARPYIAPKAAPVAAITAAPDIRVGIALPPQVAQQIRTARQRAAVIGQAPPEWAIGADVEALYAGDDQWYKAKVTGISVTSQFIVAYEGYEDPAEVSKAGIRMPAETHDSSYQGVSAPRRHSVQEDAMLTEMPAWLQIRAEDDEKTKIKKKRLQKSFKSKQRFAKMDLEQKSKADAWKTFAAGKGSKKRTGFMTGHKKESIFKVPEGGKVGVVGSGQGMTDYKKQKRHDFGSM